ncbi:MAG: hypothetical protein DME22_15435 [Verrucomicrobia bacterium]|nr:MAG: hypothetical protein DME22_15435 [Verrucomicrobiota bacterium]PYK01228.1 MAG: hypothetical protein DME23_04535 [Verrucomicrobiota bacterium]
MIEDLTQRGVFLEHEHGAGIIWQGPAPRVELRPDDSTDTDRNLLFTRRPFMTLRGPVPFKIDTLFHAGNQISFHWQGGVGPYQIQTRADLSSGAWQDLGVVNSGREATALATEGTAFYRITDLGSN